MSSPFPPPPEFGQPGFGQPAFGQQPGFNPPPAQPAFGPSPPESFQTQPPPGYYPSPPPQSGGGCMKYLLVGCLGSAVLLLLLCGGGVWWASRNVERLVATGVRQVVVVVINDSDLPAQEKTEVIEQVDRVVNAYTAKQIKPEELGQIFEDLQRSPVFVVIGSWGLDKILVEPSGLPADEKAAARKTLARAMRGVMEKKISDKEFSAAMEDHQGKPAGSLSDEEVRQTIATLKKLADDAGIPDEEVQIDISDEMKKVIDKALAGKNVE